jgi:CubicO group peptidase (beta-lactamase class C family)
MNGHLLRFACILVLFGTGCRPEEAVDDSPVARLAALERDLSSLREQRRIPGMSAAIGRGGEIIWASGFGHADLEHAIPASPRTIYHVASLTKPFASTVLLQLVEEERLDLEAPVSRFGIDLVDSDHTRVWHLLSHTGSPPAGSRYRYDGYAFGELEKVVEQTASRSFAAELTDRIITPLQLDSTAPNPEAGSAFAASGLDREAIERQMAKGYAPAWGRGIWPSGLFGPIRPMEHPTSFHPAAGLVSSAVDLARFSMAFDDGTLLGDAMRDRALRPIITPAGERLPYALGWFVQEHRGVTLVWHYGHWFSSSALIVKVPEQQLTFVILANSDGLSRRLRLGDTADVLRSPFATAFLDRIVFAGR